MSGTQGLQENLPKFVFPNIQGRLRLDGPKIGGVRVFDGLSRGKEKGKERWVNSHNSGQICRMSKCSQRPVNGRPMCAQALVLVIR